MHPITFALAFAFDAIEFNVYCNEWEVFWTFPDLLSTTKSVCGSLCALSRLVLGTYIVVKVESKHIVKWFKVRTNDDRIWKQAADLLCCFRPTRVSFYD